MSPFTLEPEWSAERRKWRYEVVETAADRRIGFTGWHKTPEEAERSAAVMIAHLLAGKELGR